MPNSVPPSESLQRPDQTLLLDIGPGHPELISALHDISQDGSSKEDHMFSPGRILDLDLEVLLYKINVTKISTLRVVVIGFARTFSLSAFPPKTLVRYSCFISFSSRLGNPGYMLDPPERTTCL